MHISINDLTYTSENPHADGNPAPGARPMMMMMMMMSFICSCRNKNQPKDIYPKGTSHHTSLFRGPITNGMKKYDDPSRSWSTSVSHHLYFLVVFLISIFVIFVWSISASIVKEKRVCCLLVLNSVTSTPQWIRQPEAAWK